MARNLKSDPAGAWLEAHGENLRRGDVLQTKVKATDLAESAPQIAKTRANRKGGINLRRVAEVLEEYGMDPTVEIVKVLPELDDALKAKVMLELLNYCQPKLKSIEHSGPNGDPMQHVGTFNINFSGKK